MWQLQSSGRLGTGEGMVGRPWFACCSLGYNFPGIIFNGGYCNSYAFRLGKPRIGLLFLSRSECSFNLTLFHFFMLSRGTLWAFDFRDIFSWWIFKISQSSAYILLGFWMSIWLTITNFKYGEYFVFIHQNFSYMTLE